MTLSRGRDLLAIPGPSIIPDRVLREMHRAAPNIYEGALIEMTETVIADLRRVARTEGSVAIYIGNGHAGWEAAIANLLAPGDRALVLATGRFGLGWAATARQMGVEVEVMDFGFRAGIDAGAGRRPAARRPRACDPRGAGGAGRHRLVGEERRPGDPRGARRRRASGAARGRFHRLPRLRRAGDGRLGRRRDGGGLPEGADDPAGARLHLPERPGDGRAGALPEPLLGLGAAGGAGGLLPALLRHGADAPPLRPARRARHDRRGGARGGLAAARASSPAPSGPRSTPGARRARWS